MLVIPSPSLAAPNGVVDITSDPNVVEILVDGVAKGSTPLTLSLPTGTHVLTAKKPGFGTAEQKITVNADIPLRLSITLSVLAEIEGGRDQEITIVADVGNLLVTADRPGVDVYVDGELRGSTSLSLTNVRAGVHTISISGTTSSVSVFKDHTLKVHYDGRRIVMLNDPRRLEREQVLSREIETATQTLRRLPMLAQPRVLIGEGQVEIKTSGTDLDRTGADFFFKYWIPGTQIVRANGQTEDLVKFEGYYSRTDGTLFNYSDSYEVKQSKLKSFIQRDPAWREKYLNYVAEQLEEEVSLVNQQDEPLNEARLCLQKAESSLQALSAVSTEEFLTKLRNAIAQLKYYVEGHTPR